MTPRGGETPTVAQILTVPDIPPSLMQAVLGTIREGILRFCREEATSLNLSRVLIAFNGGKDCTLLVYLVVAVAEDISRSREFTVHGAIRLLNIREESDPEIFTEIDQFATALSQQLGIQSIEIAGDMKFGLSQVSQNFPEVEAIFMGTRSTDPNAHWMKPFCLTSPGWPQINLIAPLLELSYHQVWRLIDGLALEVCELYTRGYTSIGRKSNTKPNPLLRVSTGYKHARELSDESMERLGRF